MHLAIKCTSAKIAELLDGTATNVIPVSSLKDAYESINAQSTSAPPVAKRVVRT